MGESDVERETEELRAACEDLLCEGGQPLFALGERALRFDVEGSESYRLEAEGDVGYRVTESHAPADCAIRCQRGDLARIIRGDQNLLTALLQGRAEIQGDLGLAQLFSAWVRARRGAAARS
jgi:putative sterol carrier protein